MCTRVFISRGYDFVEQCSSIKPRRAVSAAAFRLRLRRRARVHNRDALFLLSVPIDTPIMRRRILLESGKTKRSNVLLKTRQSQTRNEQNSTAILGDSVTSRRYDRCHMHAQVHACFPAYVILSPSTPPPHAEDNAQSRGGKKKATCRALLPKRDRATRVTRCTRALQP